MIRQIGLARRCGTVGCWLQGDTDTLTGARAAKLWLARWAASLPRHVRRRRKAAAGLSRLTPTSRLRHATLERRAASLKPQLACAMFCGLPEPRPLRDRRKPLVCWRNP
jgi:hypothetical protein